jgi:hypothetical protein
MSFLCSKRTTSLQDPPLRYGEKPIPLLLQHRKRFASLYPSTSSASPFCVSPGQQLLLFSAPACRFLAFSFLLLGDLSLTEFNSVLVREAGMIKPVSHHFDNGVAVHVNEIGSPRTPCEACQI